MDQLPRLGKREQSCLLFLTCNYVVSVWRGFLFLWVLGMGYVILLWHSLSLHIIIGIKVIERDSFQNFFIKSYVEACELKVGRYRQLIDFMKVCDY